jgi:hypothetical protein
MTGAFMPKQYLDTPYGVSKDGTVINLTTNKVRKTFKNQGGYLCLYDSYLKESFRVHRMVATLYCDNPQKLPYVNHLDGNKLNNNADNLEWCTASANTQHAYDTGLMQRGSKMKHAKLDEALVSEIKLALLEGAGPQSLADTLCVSVGTISNIRVGRAWKHVEPLCALPPLRDNRPKLCREDVVKIKSLIESCVSDREIANLFGCNSGTIYQIRIGKNWANV